ncbi:MAG: tetratricopeptide repeat protein [Treponema sp.]|nr:tetratricopeptide repeat protein [Treponema sp.]
MKLFYKRSLVTVVLLCSTFFLFAQESAGVKAFKENKPEAAAALLENELKASNPDPALYNYLGIAYYQTGNYKRSLEAFELGLSAYGTDKKVLYFNAGNCAYAMADFEKAVDYYSMAVTADSSYAEPYLNRANAGLRLDHIDECITDYETYLALRPDDPQAEKIRMMLDLLRKEKDFRIAEAQRKQLEEERRKEEEARLAAAKAEAERLAAEKRAADEERRRKQLQDIANSLKDNSDTKNMSAGTENVLNYEDESDID